MNISRIWENACFKALSKEARQIPQSQHTGCAGGRSEDKPPRYHRGEALPVSCAQQVRCATHLRNGEQAKAPSPRLPTLGPGSGPGSGQLVATGQHSRKSVSKVYLQTPTKHVTDVSRAVLNRDKVTRHQLDPMGEGMIHSQRHGAAEIPVSVGRRPSQRDQQRPVLLSLGSVCTQVLKKNLQLVSVPSRGVRTPMPIPRTPLISLSS